uniref:SH2 domain-containing protein n=3 Tax=Photinus pyralis TaxID=7054 RepID=A0A1Y1NBS7_PHOPY
MRPLKLFRSLSVDTSRSDNEWKEAADRFMDTSWQIHKQWFTETNASAFPTAEIQPAENQTNVKPNETTLTKTKRTNSVPNGIIRYSDDDARERKSGTPGRKVVQIETVQTTCESVGPPEKIKTDVILHTHEEPIKSGVGGRKMLSSSSYSSGYGETFTSQPRSTANNVAAASSGGMDLSYVTERIIAVWFPSSASQKSYREGQRHAAHMLKNKHGDNYMVFNLSEPKRALRNEHKHVKEVGWPQKLAPPLERLCSICKEIESWLSGDQHRIAVLHACGSKDKLGVVVAAYMHYSSICGTADQALDRFSMRRFLEDNIGPLQTPSNRRYVDYFAGLLSHNIKVNAAPLYLTHVTVLGAPSFQQGGCRAFLKLYEGLTPVYTSGVYSVVSGVKQFTVNLAAERRPGLQLRGDILVKCYHRGPSDRETIFACQFHTCAVADNTLSFTRQELDNACNDPRFPPDGAVELHFCAGPEGRMSAPAPTPAVPVTLTEDPVTRADSPLELDDSNDESDGEDVNHTFGPLDGSIYATIAKKPELSPGAVSSPLTVSMDSGISSAGHQQNAHTNASTSPPLTAQPSPLTPEDQHRELDELLTDMMLTVQSIPDVKPRQSPSVTNGTTFNLDHVKYIDEEEDKNIPYHARHDSRPFSYGVNSSMINEGKGLSSPSLVRKASFNKSSGDTLKKVQTQVFPDSNFSSYPSGYPTYNTSKYGTYSTSYNKKDPIDDIFTVSALNSNRQPYRREYREEYYKDEVKKYEPMKRSLTDGSLRRTPEKVHEYKTSSSLVTSPYSDGENLSPPGAFRSSPRSPEFHETYSTSNLTWLQKQQLKLKERREMQLREERQPHETRLLSELRNIQARHIRPSASHRADGYTSDTTAFADDDEDFTVPLHINTTSRNVSSVNSPPSGKTIYSTNERPFMSVKRIHEKFVQNSTSPASALMENPMGHAIRSPSRGGPDSTDGLLSLVEQEQYFKQSPHPSNSPLYRDESISSWRTQSVSEMESSPPHSVSPRPQTPAFPVHPRTPYTNASTPTVQFDLPSERLPPKSPTTQRRLSYPTSALKSSKGRSNSPGSKDRPTSPSELSNGTLEYSHSVVQRSTSATPTSHNYKENFADGYQHSPVHNGSASPTVYYVNSRRSSVHSESPQEVSPAHVKFVRDTSKYWYKPTISREEAISLLRTQPPGTFVVRDSNSFPGAFGLALKVATLPSNVQAKSPSSDEFVRHFLIEPTSRGVRLKGCSNEPVFSSLSALIYQHSVIQMALPCRLVLPEGDVKQDSLTTTSQAWLSQGAACNVLYLFSLDMESLTGPQAIKKAVVELFQKSPVPTATIVHFKVNGQGITLTDHKRKVFFRRHYPINTVSYCGEDPDEHRWSVGTGEEKSSNKIFGYVARKPASNTDNQCHLFAELEPEQPATAIVNFVNKMLSSSGIKANIV